MAINLDEKEETKHIIELMEQGCEDHLVDSKQLVTISETNTKIRMSDVLQFFIKDGEIKFVRSLKLK